MTTQTGTVKWFNEAKGYGFIAQDAGGADLFGAAGEAAQRRGNADLGGHTNPPWVMQRISRPPPRGASA